MHHQVLIYGHDSILLQTRQLVLEGARFEVRVSEALEEAGAILATHPVDLLILCHTVGAQERSILLDTARACHKNLAVLFLSVDYQSPIVAENGAVFTTLDGPYDFLRAVCQLTHEPAPPPLVPNSPNSGPELCHDLQAR